MIRRESLIKKLLRVLTPEEISELTTTVDGSNRVPLTDLVENTKLTRKINFLNPFKGDLIPIVLLLEIKNLKKSSYQEYYSLLQDEEGENTFMGKSVFESLRKLTTQINLDSKLDKESVPFKDTLHSKNGEVFNTSLFILNEKERFKENNFKLKERQVLSTYGELSQVVIQRFDKDEKNSSLENEEDNSERLKLKSYLGKLIDKKAS